MNPVSTFYYYLRITGDSIVPLERSVIGFYHLMIVLKGNFTFIINGNEIAVGENDVLLLPPGTERGRHPHPNSADFVVFNFKLSKDQEISSHILFKNGANPMIRRLIDSYPYKYFNDYSSSFDFYKHPSYKIENSREMTKIKYLLHNILNCILIELFDSLNYSAHNPHVFNTLKYINDNISEPITLNDVCQAIHLSKEYTARIFKKEMNITVTEYIIEQKLSLARSMLISDELDLRDISEKVGYQDYNYFSRLFKKHYGISPLKMRKEFKNTQK